MIYKSLFWSTFALLLFVAFGSGYAQTNCTFTVNPSFATQYIGSFTVTPSDPSCVYGTFASAYAGYVSPRAAPDASGVTTFDYGYPSASQYAIAIGNFGPECNYTICAFSGPLTILPVYPMDPAFVAPQTPSSLHLVTTSMPDAELQTYYSYQLEAEGGTPPYTWDCISCSTSNPREPLQISPSGIVTSAPSFDPGVYANYPTLYSHALILSDSAGHSSLVSIPYKVYPSHCEDAGGDSDGDGLCDDWETNGITLNGIKLDLPAMGANPQHKDLFVQADYMKTAVSFSVFGHNHKPDFYALQQVTQAFASAPVSNPDGTTGITLHVDCGADCVMNPATTQTWGSLSEAHIIPEETYIGAVTGVWQNWTYIWDDFEAKKSSNLSIVRQKAFHYAIFAHELPLVEGQPKGKRVIGIANVPSPGYPGSDFLVTLGSQDHYKGTVRQQAVTFMHEAGHTLSLRHGGNDDINMKPNFLSIMNYSFPLGLIVNGVDYLLDYSKWALPSLAENALSELNGLGADNTISSYGTYYYCPNETPKREPFAIGSIDWNCDGTIEPGLEGPLDINGDNYNTALTGYNDWAHIVLRGGSMGVLGGPNGASVASQNSSEPAYPDDIVALQPYNFVVSSPGTTLAHPGDVLALTFTITNQGTEDDVYKITSAATVNWFDTSTAPSSIALAHGASTVFTIYATVPTNSPTATLGTLTIKAQSGGSNVVDQDSAEITVAGSALPVTASPTFSPFPGAFNAAQTVTLTSTTAGAKIFYTTDGSPAGSNSIPYVAPFKVGNTQTVRAVALANGYAQSGTASATYTINPPAAATPSLSPAGGVILGVLQTVTLTDSTPGASIYYSLDGSNPSVSSTLYTTPFPVSGTQTVKAVAIAPGYASSSVGSATYTMVRPVMVTVTPEFLTLKTPQSATTVTITTWPLTDAVIHYTLDGSKPDENSPKYTGPFQVIGPKLIEGWAFSNGLLVGRGGAIYSSPPPPTIPLPRPTPPPSLSSHVSVPSFSPAPGTFTSPQTVTLSGVDIGASIYMTFDGHTAPTTSSTRYTGPITVSNTQTIQAIAVDPGLGGSSAVVSATYTIVPYASGASAAPRVP